MDNRKLTIISSIGLAKIKQNGKLLSWKNHVREMWPKRKQTLKIKVETNCDKSKLHEKNNQNISKYDEQTIYK